MNTKTAREALAARKASKDRSAWDKGVTQTAINILDYFSDEQKLPRDFKELDKMLLNYADSWSDYSNGGSALICNEDIARLYCTPSELKRTKNGERNPNGRETWIDLQARALKQAARRVWRVVNSER